MPTPTAFAGTTRLVTSSGPRSVAEVSREPIHVLTSEGKWAEVHARAVGLREFVPLDLSRNGVTKQILAYPQQRWALRTHSSGGTRYWGKRPSSCSTTDLVMGDRLASCFAPRPLRRRIDPTAAARGFVFGDGTAAGSQSIAYFCGSKDEEVRRTLFADLGRPPRAYGSVVRIGGLPLEWKREIPRGEVDADEIYGWLAGYFAADGDVDGTGRPTLSSADESSLVAVRTLCDLVGIGTYGVRRRMRVGYGVEPSPLYLLGFMRGDLDEAFFLLAHHRSRFLAGSQALERRGWRVAGLGNVRCEEAFVLLGTSLEGVALEDHLLAITSGVSAGSQP